MKRTLIKNGLIVDMAEHTEQARKADILIEDKYIKTIAGEIEAADDMEVISAEGKIVMPGLIDTHRHTWESIIRHIGTDWSLPNYLGNLYFNQLGSRLSPDEYRTANTWGALEALDAGVTTMLDYSMLETPEHADAAVQGLHDAGIRAVFAHGPSGRAEYWDRTSEKRHPQDSRRVKKEYFQSGDQLLTMALGIRGPEFSSWAAAVDDIHTARELDAIASMHIGFGSWGPEDQSIQRLHDAGLLGPDLNLVHMNRVQDHEYELAAQSGASFSVTPEIEMMMGHGYPATGKMHKADGLVTLGVDVVVSTAGEMFSQMKFALQAERARQNQKVLESGNMPENLGLTTTDVLTFSTINGARALHLDKKTGTIETGKEADIILVSTDAFNMFPLNDKPVEAVVQSAKPENIDTVFVAGTKRKEKGRLLINNAEALKKEVQEAGSSVLERQRRLEESMQD